MSEAGRLLLDLTLEYAEAVQARKAPPGVPDIGTPVERDPDEIAADYEAALRELLS